MPACAQYNAEAESEMTQFPVIITCRIPVGWFPGSDVRTKSFFSPPSYGLILVLLYLVPSYLLVWCGD